VTRQRILTAPCLPRQRTLPPSAQSVLERSLQRIHPRVALVTRKEGVCVDKEMCKLERRAEAVDTENPTPAQEETRHRRAHNPPPPAHQDTQNILYSMTVADGALGENI
jgi:hypothetical protein